MFKRITHEKKPARDPDGIDIPVKAYPYIKNGWLFLGPGWGFKISKVTKK
jgi:hypothetical protein